ncbi:MAG: VWA domain-containing protein [Oligoflexia bacterium]|nr:VWA domain-containing protein [Oligoflexia bacterium]
MKLILSLAILFSFLGCSDVKLQKRQEELANVQSEGTFCTQSPSVTTGKTKFMFVIDKSGSNGSTDPNNLKRAKNLEKFFNGPDTAPRKLNSGIEWGFIEFSGDTATAYINEGGDGRKPIFVGVPDNEAAMSQALQKLRGPDGGSTPYKAALALTKKAIQDDVTKHPGEASSYVIFFMSDGMPTDYGFEGPAGPEAFRDVDELVNMLPGQITFSTAYYGPFDPEAAEGLRIMAEHGHGKFVDTNQTDDFTIDDLLVGGPRADTYIVGKLLVFNINSAICLDNSIGTDSDGDGLCDLDEERVTGTDPRKRFSFSTGYSDYFHYMALLAKTVLPVCTDRSDEDFDLLTACEESLMYNSRPSGTTKNKADPKNPDTDFDGFIDGIEYFFLHNKSAALDNLNIFKSFDGESINAGEQIHQHRNPLYNDSRLPISDLYDTRADFVGYNAVGQSCYRFRQDFLKTYPTKAVSPENSLGFHTAHKDYENVVLFYFIQVLERDPAGPGIYVFSHQKVTGNPSTARSLGRQSGLQINQGIFTSYIVPQQ